MFDNLSENWIYLGQDYIKFWDYTYREIIKILEVLQKKEETKARETLVVNYNLASNIINFLGLSLNGKPIPKLKELYPDFDVSTQPVNPELEAIKINEQLKQFANVFNKRVGKDD